MRKKSALIGAICFLLAIFLALQGTSKSLANESKDLFDENAFIANMDNLGIEKSIQENLLNKIRNGELLDSNNPEKIKEIAECLKVSIDKPRVEHTFPDGSKIVLEMTIYDKHPIYSFDTLIIPQSQFVTRYPHVRYNDTIISCEYWATVQLNLHYPTSRINSVYDDRVRVNWGSFWDQRLRIITQVQPNFHDWAKARLSFTAQYSPAGYILWTRTCWLELHVRNTQINTVFTMY